MWAGWSDEDTEGKFADPTTGEMLDLEGYAPFRIGEPNGEEAENCIVKYTDENNMVGDKFWVDKSCDEESIASCFLKKTPAQFKLRGVLSFSCTKRDPNYLPNFAISGLPPGIPFDKEYSMNTNLHGGQYQFSGYTNSFLRYNELHQEWVLGIYGRESSTRATTSGKEYPIGTQTWRIETPGFNESRELSLNSCSDQQEYNCADGSCIDIGSRKVAFFVNDTHDFNSQKVSLFSRCDRKHDCKDGSDEIDCGTIQVDKSYLKDQPPAPTNSASPSRYQVVLSIDISNVLSIDEVESVLKLQYHLVLTWLDPRLKYRNLKRDSHLNGGSKDIWYPRLVFFNTMDKEDTKVIRAEIIPKTFSSYYFFSV